jgi:hypothetical protein
MVGGCSHGDANGTTLIPRISPISAAAARGGTLPPPSKVPFFSAGRMHRPVAYCERQGRKASLRDGPLRTSGGPAWTPATATFLISLGPPGNQSCLSGRLAAQTRPLLLPGW